MASVKILLKEAQPKKDGTYPILIRVTMGRKSRYISTGYAVKKTQFKEGSENWIVKHPDAYLMNAGLEKKRAALMAKVYHADIEGTDLDLKAVSGKTAGETFIKMLMAQKTIFEKRNQVSAYDKLTTRINNLKTAWGQDIPAQSVNKAWVDRYINDRYQKNASPNTVRKDLSIFGSVLQKWEGFTGKNPFKDAQKTIVKIPINREKLTVEEIKSLESVTLYGLNDVARDMFLFSFYTHGMRFQSVAMFERSSIQKGLIRYRMNKGKKIREIEIHQKLQAIIDKYFNEKTPYLFPIMKNKVLDDWQKNKEIDSANVLINTRLKRVAVICGIEKNLTTHIAKHSFAFLSLERGVSYSVLKDALGHSDYTTTQMYLSSLSDDVINDAVKGLYD